jgi:hypothetical protein
MMEDNHERKSNLTTGLADRISSNCFTSSGGESLSISAPSIEIGMLTPEFKNNN